MEQGLIEYLSPLKEALGHWARYRIVKDMVFALLGTRNLSVMGMASFFPGVVQEEVSQSQGHV